MVFRIIVDATVATRGLENIANRAIPDAIKETLDKGAQSAIDGAQGVVPVVTGQLRDSIGVKEQGSNFVVVAADTDYAAAIEFGDGTRAAQPYLGPQADRLQSEASNILAKALKSKI